MNQKFNKQIKEFKLVLKTVPTFWVVLFVMAVFTMNLLANKSINLPFDWLALDAGIIVSWFAFLAMDVITKHFGPKASTEISLFATFINLLFCFILFIGSQIDGVWGESFVEGSQNLIINALDKTFGGTWYVVVGSTVAFVVSAIVNNATNWAIGRLLAKKADNFWVFGLRSYISTAIGQFTDNIIFALLVSHFFFGWTILQCVTCAITGMIAELLFEVVFSYLGYKIVKKWQKEGVGKEYFDYLKEGV